MDLSLSSSGERNFPVPFRPNMGRFFSTERSSGFSPLRHQPTLRYLSWDWSALDDYLLGPSLVLREKNFDPLHIRIPGVGRQLGNCGDGALVYLDPGVIEYATVLFQTQRFFSI